MSSVEDRRTYMRMSDVVRVSFIPRDAPGADNVAKMATSVDISGGGIRLITPEELPVRSRILMHFEIHAQPESIAISCMGEVMWRTRCEGADCLLYEMGVRFLDIPEERHNRLIAHTHAHHFKVPEGEESAIEVEGLTKRYGRLLAVDNLSFTIRKGEIFALLGANGAGKTTTTRILSTLLRPTSGRIRILGHDVTRDKNAVRRLIGYMPQNYVLYDDLTARENLEFFGRAYGLRGKTLKERIDEALVFTELEQRGGSLFRTFSGGMRQRLSLACALLHRPQVLFLDEPTAGVDLKLRKNFWDYFHELADAGVTIFVTTHQMDEVEYCYRVAFLHGGKIILDEPPARLKCLGKTQLTVHGADGAQRYDIEDYKKDIPNILCSIFNEGRPVLSMEIEERGLEDILREKIGQ